MSLPDPSHAMPPTEPVPWFPETPEAASVALLLCAALPDVAQPPLVQSSDDHALSSPNLGWVFAELGNIRYYKYTVILREDSPKKYIKLSDIGQISLDTPPPYHIVTL